LSPMSAAPCELKTDNLVKTWAKIAVRNLFKNRRRSLFTILAIGLAFAAVNVFGGFTAYMFSNLEDSYIYSQANAHITIFKKGFLTKGRLDPVRFLMSEQETQSVAMVLKSFPEVLLVTTQLYISGLASNGKVSTVFIGVGRPPDDVRFINSRAKSAMLAKLRLFQGKPLEDDVIYGTGVSTAMAQILDLKLSGDFIAMAPTVEGQLNAMDAQVFQLFDPAVETLNDKLIRVPLKFAQSLYDTRSVDRISVLLSDTRDTDSMRAKFVQALTDRHLDLEIKTWEEIDPIYTKIRDMFNIIFLFIFVIVFVIAVMSIINTMSMTVLERTREIGTLRALGFSRLRIVGAFLAESVVLALIGGVIGCVLALPVHGLSTGTTNMASFSEVAFKFRITPALLAGGLAFAALMGGVGGLLPALRAARIPVARALREI